MSKYILNLGEELKFALKPALTCHPVDFAGYSVNIDFWYKEYRHLKTIADQCDERFSRTVEAGKYYHEARILPETPDAGPFTAPSEKTTPRERQVVLREVRECLFRILDRSQELNTIPVETHDWYVRELSTEEEES